MMLQSGNEVKTSNRYVYFTDALYMIATYMHSDRQARIIRSTETRNIEFDLIICACRRDVIRTSDQASVIMNYSITFNRYRKTLK